MSQDLAAAILAAIEQRASERHDAARHCVSFRSRKHMQIRADEAGQLVAVVKQIIKEKS